MSWHDRAFRRRFPISVPNSGAVAGTVDIDAVIPKDLDDFWDVIDADGEELRVTDADGYDLLNYDVDDGAGGAFDSTARDGRIRIDGAATNGFTDSCLIFWVYYDPDETQGDGSTAVTITSALTGYFERGAPSTWIAAAETPRPGLDAPRDRFTKTVADEPFLWLDFTEILEQRGTTFAGRRVYEEPREIVYEIQDDTGTPDTDMVEPADTRWVELVEGTNGRRLYARLRVLEGTDTEDYTLVATCTTFVPEQFAAHRTLAPRVGFQVRDVQEGG